MSDTENLGHYARDTYRNDASQHNEGSSMLVHVNYLAVLLATLSAVIVGTIWYSPKVFGTAWQRLAKIDPNRQSSMTIPHIVAVLMSFVTSWVQAAATDVTHTALGSGSPAYVLVSLLVGFTLWAGFTGAGFLTHHLFEGRPGKLTIINIGLELVTILITALIIGVWPPLAP